MGSLWRSTTRICSLMVRHSEKSTRPIGACERRDVTTTSKPLAVLVLWSRVHVDPLDQTLLFGAQFSDAWFTLAETRLIECEERLQRHRPGEEWTSDPVEPKPMSRVRRYQQPPHRRSRVPVDHVAKRWRTWSHGF